MRILVLTTFKRINSGIVKTLRKKSLLISKGRFRATVVYERTDIKSQQFTTEESKSIGLGHFEKPIFCHIRSAPHMQT